MTSVVHSIPPSAGPLLAAGSVLNPAVTGVRVGASARRRSRSGPTTPRTAGPSGLSLREIMEGASGTHSQVKAALAALLADNLIVSRGATKDRRYRAAEIGGAS